MPRFNNRNKKNDKFNQRMNKTEEDASVETVEGRVMESLPNTHFRVQIPNSDSLVCYLSGKMRVNKIKILTGDRVLLQLDEYGGKPRIIRRF